MVARTGRKYMVYYGERLTSEAAMFATELTQAGVLGRVVQVVGLGPHRLGKASRPDWFIPPELLPATPPPSVAPTASPAASTSASP